MMIAKISAVSKLSNQDLEQVEKVVKKTVSQKPHSQARPAARVEVGSRTPGSRPQGENPGNRSEAVPNLLRGGAFEGADRAELPACELQILSNGSKWAGDEPNTVDQLIDLLSRETLDPSFIRYGNFFFTEDGKEFCAFGNFLGLSHVFNIRGPRGLMMPLARALKVARRRPEFLREREKMIRELA